MSALPPIDDRLLPADVRAGSDADQARYKTALSFERELVEQLTQQLASTATTSADGSDDDGSGDAATSLYQQEMPGVLADSIMQAGGLGLARTVAQAMKEAGQ
ncbi:MAG TPA: hypothetical protein VFT50_08610 [Baekduia sp.]|nr:hypothetical protein [Baekduia sp.]